MGIHKFRLPPPEVTTPPPDVRKGFIAGLDRMPARTLVELRPGLLLCHRDIPDSGKLHIPWPVAGQGMPMISTATLSERALPYDLLLELARGKLNDLRNQLADWKTHLLLQGSNDLDAKLREAQRLFARAATNQDDLLECSRSAQSSLNLAFEAADLGSMAYIERLMQLRKQHNPKLPTLLGCVLEDDPSKASWSQGVAEACNSVRLPMSWRDIAPAEGSYRWEITDAQLAWCRRKGLAVSAGPLVEFRSTAVPDWLSLFLGNGQGLLSVVLDWVEAAVNRYRGKISVWHVVSRVGTPRALGLSEDDQIQVAARILQACRRFDPNAQFVVDFDRPWAEWLGSTQTTHQLGPLHLGDYLARAELGMSGVGLEIAPGYSAPGSHMRDLLEFSRLLDLYALLNMPLHLTMAVPSTAAADPHGASVQASQWPRPIDPTFQRDWAARWIALAVSKPYVRSITWSRLTDKGSQGYPGAGLFNSNGAAKPIVSWLKNFRSEHLA